MREKFFKKEGLAREAKKEAADVAAVSYRGRMTGFDRWHICRYSF